MSTGVRPAPEQYVPAESQLVVAYSVCRSITRAAAKNFYYSFLVLPKTKSQALCSVYAFMRRCDDIADDTTIAAAERQQKLAAWVDALHRAQAGHPTDEPVLLALTDTQRRFSIPASLLDQLAYGTAMDVIEVKSDEASSSLLQYKTFEELCFYCYRVASVVGLVCIRIFGYNDPAAEKLAEQLGLAFQLTNIIRDVKEDLEMGRVYLPEEDLARFNVTPEDFRTAPISPQVRSLLELEAHRAREYYLAADGLIPMVDEDSQPALWVLSTIYRNLLEKIRRLQYDVFTQKVRLTTREKLVVLGKGLIRRLT